MFELSVACKYLIPRWRQLSVSIISLISVLVIALVVWLIVVFFSVTDGLEKNWVQKLTALTAPVRLTPTDAYYHSYYYLVDSISESSNYSLKTLGEKRKAPSSNPYDPAKDEEIPSSWPAPDLDAEGKLKDPVKLAFGALDEIKNVKGLQSQDFELTATHIQLNLLRPTTLFHSSNVYGGTTQSSLSYPAYLGNFDSNNRTLENTLLPLQEKDFNNMFSMIGIAPPKQAEGQEEKTFFEPMLLAKRLKAFFESVEIQELKTRAAGWTIPRRLTPEQATWSVCAVFKEHDIVRVVVPQKASACTQLRKGLEEQGLTVEEGEAVLNNRVVTIRLANRAEHILPPRFTLTLAGGSSFSAQLDRNSIESPRVAEEVLFNVEIPVQGQRLQGKVPFRGLEIAKVQQLPLNEDSSPWWIYKSMAAEGKNLYVLPKDPELGEGIALPKSFRDAGVLIGDRGSLSYYSPTPSILQELQIPIYVAGFYDQGIIPIGGKYILANQEITSLIRASHQQDDKTAMTNGINVRFDHLAQANDVKAQVLAALKRKGVNSYWNVETYREYEFTKEIMRELQSQKNLFMLIAVVIILVACSNIISMLIILVNDKKAEIGILRSMGASSKSIALIFGSAGAIIGVVGSAAGILASILTLRYLNVLVGLLSSLQGHDMFSANLYGQVLPHELSYEALSFVLLATVCISLLAGIVPAIKACLLRPTHILRSGGG